MSCGDSLIYVMALTSDFSSVYPHISIKDHFQVDIFAEYVFAKSIRQNAYLTEHFPPQRKAVS